MKGFQPLGAFRRGTTEFVNDVLSQRFFHDRLSMSVLSISAIVNVACVLLLIAHVHPTDSQVPIHFSSFTLFDALGPWYYPFEIALIAVLITLVNAVFAYHSFGRSRLASFFLVVTGLVVAVFSFIIAQAFGAVR
jgi:hypothetical protein